MRAYADIIADADGLQATLDLLVPLQGRERIAEWSALAREGAHERLAAELMREHYDPRYAKARGTQDGAILDEIALDGLGEAALEDAAERIEKAVAGM